MHQTQAQEAFADVVGLALREVSHAIDDSLDTVSRRMVWLPAVLAGFHKVNDFSSRSCGNLDTSHLDDTVHETNRLMSAALSAAGTSASGARTMSRFAHSTWCKTV